MTDDLIIGVISSIAATAILALVARLLPTRFRSFIFFLFSKWLKCGITFIFQNEDEAASDILFYANRSKEVKVLSIRCNRITSPERPLSKLLSSECKFERIEFMLAALDSPALDNRAKGFATVNVTYPVPGMYKNDIVRSLNVLYEAKFRNPRIVSIKTHHQPESFRLIIADEYLYLSFFPPGITASASRVYKIPRESELYNAYNEHYNWVKNSASENYFGQYQEQ